MVHEANQFWSLSLLLPRTGQQLNPVLGKEMFPAHIFIVIFSLFTIVPVWNKNVMRASVCM